MRKKPGGHHPLGINLLPPALPFPSFHKSTPSTRSSFPLTLSYTHTSRTCTQAGANKLPSFPASPPRPRPSGPSLPGRTSHAMPTLDDLHAAIESFQPDVVVVGADVEGASVTYHLTHPPSSPSSTSAPPSLPRVLLLDAGKAGQGRQRDAAWEPSSPSSDTSSTLHWCEEEEVVAMHGSQADM